MKAKIAVAFVINACIAMPVIAADIYRWTDPETGKVITTTSLPPYPVKEKRTAGGLPGGELVNVILDTDAPQVKAIIEKRKTKEEQEKHIAEENQKKKEAREAHGKLLAIEMEKQEAERKANTSVETTSGTACRYESDLHAAMESVLNDKDTYHALHDGKRCFEMGPGHTVTIVARSRRNSFAGGYAQIMFKGERLWTTLSSLKNYTDADLNK